MRSAPETPPYVAGQADLAQDPPTGISDMARWREAWRIRRAHPRWVVLWDAPAGQYRAYRRARARRETKLTDDSPEGLAAQIEKADQAERPTPV
jgi:hypothetical protein